MMDDLAQQHKGASLPPHYAFSVAKFKQDVPNMTEQQAKDGLAFIYEAYFMQRAYYEELIKMNWGL